MLQKQKNVERFWYANAEERQELNKDLFFDFENQYDSLEKFTGTHPLVMKDRIAKKNWDIVIDTSKKYFSFKGRLLYWIEKKTGKRLFDFRNYKII